MGNYISKIFGKSPVGPIQDHMDICYRCDIRDRGRDDRDVASMLKTLRHNTKAEQVVAEQSATSGKSKP